MKTIRTIATVLLAAFLVLGPVVAFAAGETVTVSTNAPSTGVSGNAVITVTGTVSPPPSAANTAVVVTTTNPTGSVVDTGPATVAASTGAYSYTFEAGGTPMWTTGTYNVNATYGGPGGTGSATTTFTYTASGSGGVTTVTVTSTSTSTITTTTTLAEVTSTIVNPDTATLQTITTDLSTLTTAINGLVSSVNTISSGISSIQSTLGSVTTGISTVSGISTQLTNVMNGVNNDQTYVLVVAALAAITLVLELAILVRKLS